MPVRKVVNVPLSTDKGMCGGVNTQISKLAVACTKVDAEGALIQRGQCMSHVSCVVEPPRVPTDTEKETRIMCVGSKGANPIKRQLPNSLDGVLADYSKNKITFALVCCLLPLSKPTTWNRPTCVLLTNKFSSFALYAFSVLCSCDALAEGFSLELHVYRPPVFVKRF